MTKKKRLREFRVCLRSVVRGDIFIEAKDSNEAQKLALQRIGEADWHDEPGDDFVGVERVEEYIVAPNGGITVREVEP